MESVAGQPTSQDASTEYEAPVAFTFTKQALIDDLPDQPIPHVHAIQNS